jgi:hypothetical protein
MAKIGIPVGIEEINSLLQEKGFKGTVKDFIGSKFVFHSPLHQLTFVGLVVGLSLEGNHRDRLKAGDNYDPTLWAQLAHNSIGIPASIGEDSEDGYECEFGIMEFKMQGEIIVAEILNRVESDRPIDLAGTIEFLY